MEIRSFELPPIGTNAYLVLDPARGEAVLIDAPLNAYLTCEKILVETGYRLSAVLMTHGHWDHMLDGAQFNGMGVPVYGHEADADFFTRPEVMSTFAIPGMPMPAMRVDHWVTPGQTLELLGQTVEVRHVPGHSGGSVLFYWPEQAAAFSGDVVFAGSVGRTDFPGCSFATLEKSIREQVYTLPGETTLYPGHGPKTTVGQEKESNPFVSGA